MRAATRIRKYLSGFHLILGIAAAAVLAFMAATGFMLAFAPEWIAWSERGAARLPDAGAPRQGLGPLLAAASAAAPGKSLREVVLDRDPRAALAIASGPERTLLRLDARTGEILGRESRTRRLLRDVERWHRRLGMPRGAGESLAGAAALALAGLALSGLLLSGPWIRRFGTRPGLPLGNAKASHALIGIGFAPVFLALGLSGALMAFPGAADRMFGAGQALPKRAERPGGPGRADGPAGQGPIDGAVRDWGNVHVSLDSLAAFAVARVPGWRSLSVRIPDGDGEPWKGSILAYGPMRFPVRSRFDVDPATGRASGWRDPEKAPWGARARAWLPALHTGRGFGAPGQAVAAAAALGLLFQIATAGLLAARRRRPGARATGPAAGSPAISGPAACPATPAFARNSCPGGRPGCPSGRSTRPYPCPGCRSRTPRRR